MRHKPDNNQNTIVAQLRKLGYTVEPGHHDILVGANGKTQLPVQNVITYLQKMGQPNKAETVSRLLELANKPRTYWYEIKDPSVISPKTGQPRPSSITASERKRLDNWRGHYKLVWTLEQILEEINETHH